VRSIGIQRDKMVYFLTLLENPWDLNDSVKLIDISMFSYRTNCLLSWFITYRLRMDKKKYVSAPSSLEEKLAYQESAFLWRPSLLCSTASSFSLPLGLVPPPSIGLPFCGACRSALYGIFYQPISFPRTAPR
jgi:hypothetical protein